MLVLVVLLDLQMGGNRSGCGDVDRMPIQIWCCWGTKPLATKTLIMGKQVESKGFDARKRR